MSANPSENTLNTSLSAQICNICLEVATAPFSSFIFIFIWLFPLSELSLWQAFCICQVMPLEMSLWARQQPPVCILIAYLHNIQAVEKDHVFIINTRVHTPNDTLYIHRRTDYQALFFVICSVGDLLPNLIFTCYCHEIFSYHSDVVCSVNSIRLNVKMMQLARSFELQL